MRIKIIALVFIVIVLCACGTEPERAVNSSNQKADVELMFELDGYRMYRFSPDIMQHDIYFVIPSGSTHWTESYGKGQTKSVSVYTAPAGGKEAK